MLVNCIVMTCYFTKTLECSWYCISKQVYLVCTQSCMCRGSRRRVSKHHEYV